jgi:hypothetical protein
VRKPDKLLWGREEAEDLCHLYHHLFFCVHSWVCTLPKKLDIPFVCYLLEWLLLLLVRWWSCLLKCWLLAAVTCWSVDCAVIAIFGAFWLCYDWLLRLYRCKWSHIYIDLHKIVQPPSIFQCVEVSVEFVIGAAKKKVLLCAAIHTYVHPCVLELSCLFSSHSWVHICRLRIAYVFC